MEKVGLLREVNFFDDVEVCDEYNDRFRIVGKLKDVELYIYNSGKLLYLEIVVFSRDEISIRKLRERAAAIHSTAYSEAAATETDSSQNEATCPDHNRKNFIMGCKTMEHFGILQYFNEENTVVFKTTVEKHLSKEPYYLTIQAHRKDDFTGPALNLKINTGVTGSFIS